MSMKDQLQRRTFLQRFSLGLSSLIALPLFSQSTSSKNTMTAKSNILRIRALGFQWETADPFLFCVHHEDKYPKGNEKMGPISNLEGRYLGQDFIVKDGFRM